MKYFCISVVFFVLFPFVLGARGGEDPKEDSSLGELVVYSSPSFSSEWGPGPAVAQGFEEQTGYKIRYVSSGSMGMVLNRLILEKETPQADLVVGLNDGMLGRVKKEGILEPYQGEGPSFIAPDLLFDKENYLIPYDYGHYAIIYDAEFLDNPPKSLEDLTHPRFADSLILMDPRSSATGRGFLLWTIAAYGKDWEDYWRRLEPSLLTVADGWSQGYALFTAGEAPLVLSYATSPVYHAAYEDTLRYKAASFPQGHYLQIEGAGVVAGTEQRQGALDFIDYLLTPEVQETIAMANIMMPVNPGVTLPQVFEAALHPEKVLSLPPQDQEKYGEEWLKQWSSLFQK